MSRTAIVVGGGIGGLASAIALGRIGWRVTVLERSAQFGEVGAGFSQSPNALACYDELGVGDRVRQLGVPFYGTFNIRTPNGRFLTRLTERDEVPLLGFHRADLHGVLLDAASRHELVAGVEVAGVGQTSEAASVSAADGRTWSADVVIGADGIGSAVRATVVPEASDPEFWKYTVWRGVAEMPLAGVEGSITFGRGCYFLIMPIARGRVYWALGASAERPRIRFTDEQAEVARKVAGWHDPIGRLVDATPHGSVLHHDVTDLDHAPLSAFANGRVALLGDAAHPMSPDLAQGAAMTVEDAIVLADALSRTADVPAALEDYDRLRRPRAQWIAHEAHRGGLGNISNSRASRGLRIALLTAMPSRTFLALSVRGLDKVWGWRPPALSS